MNSLLVAFCLSLGAQAAGEKPNILWITCEDISPDLGCYGDDYAVTPNLDRLARQGVRYTHAFAPIGVCAPSRSSLILGTYASSAGTQHMRCTGILPAYLKCFTEYLRAAGYYATNNDKTDYNFPTPREAWDESSKKAHWRGRKPGQPFFAVFNLESSHESQIRLAEPEYRARTEAFGPGEVHDPARARVPPYHPDTPEVRRDWARYADMITLMDRQVGRLLRQLEEDGLEESTIVVFFSDHGAGMPRSKRWLYDSSLRVPLIVRFPETWKGLAPAAPGTTCDRMVTFVDFGPTVLSLAGVPVPPHMQGTPFLGTGAGKVREYVHGFRDRMDERYDMVRCVRDRRWKYIRNFRPDLPWAQHIGYMYEMPTMQVWQRLHDEGKLDEVRDRFFRTKPAEELYDTEVDPWEVRNLAGDPAHRPTLERLRGELRRWILETRDLGFLPEAELRTRFGDVPLHEAVRKDPGSYPLERILEAAERATLGDPAVGFLKDDDPAVRWWGVVGCRVQGPRAPGSGEALRKALADPSWSVRVGAADALARLGRTDEALPVLIQALAHESDWIRIQALNVLDALGERARPALGAIRKTAERKQEYVDRLIEHSLRAIGEPTAVR